MVELIPLLGLLFTRACKTRIQTQDQGYGMHCIGKITKMFMLGEGRGHHREEGIKFDCYMLCVSIKETCMNGYGLNVEMFI